jgi:hypothetical protein
VVLLKKLDQEEMFNLLPNKEFISNYISKNKKLRSEKISSTLLTIITNCNEIFNFPFINNEFQYTPLEL